MKRTIKFLSFIFVFLLALTLFSCSNENNGQDGREVQFQVSETHIQWRYVGEENWNNVVSLDSLKGETGVAGNDGKQILLQVSGSQLQWKYEGDEQWNNLISLESLKGEPGRDGVDGTDGKDGVDGTDGKDGINGNDGIDGQQVQIRVTETHIQWKYEDQSSWSNLVSLESLKGAAGQNGTNGVNGKEVEFKVTATHIQWAYVGTNEYTNLIALADLIGQDGASGANGENGKSAYDLYKEAFPEYEGSEEQWILDLVNGDLKDKANYTITFNSNGGSAVESQTVKHLSKITKPENPTKEGFLFAGWFIDGEQWAFVGYVVTEDMELVAKWEEAYTVTFLDHEGQVIKTQVVLPGQDAVAPEIGLIPGFIFLEWDVDFTNVTENLIVNGVYQTDTENYMVQLYDTLDEEVVDVVHVLKGGHLLTRPEEPTKEGYYFKGWYLDEHGSATKKYYFGEPLEEHIILYTRWVENDGQLPRVDVNLAPDQYGNPVELSFFYANSTNKDTYKDATITITNTIDEHTLLSTKVNAEFRGRGHGSWDNFAKKGFKIKFNKKQGLFGQVSNKHWALVAGGHDRSMLRHNMAYTFADEVFDHIKYQTAVNEVELYVNGVYHGVYSLFEQIRPDEGRVDVGPIFNDPENSGYLVEMDEYARNSDPNTIFFINNISKPFLIKGPKMEDWEEKGMTSAEARAQRDYIKGYFQLVYSAIFSKDETTFRSLADVDSFIDMYLLHEFMKNTDTGWSSFYFYKHPGGKLYAGPAWDFDLSSGAQEFSKLYENSRGYVAPDQIYVGGQKDSPYSVYNGSRGQHSELFIELMSQPWFVTAAKARFLEIADRLEASIERYFAKVNQPHYVAAYERDKVRWDDGSSNGATGNKYINYKEQQDYFYDWLIARLDWMTNSWASV